MITTGSKFFYGLGVFGLVAALVYSLSSDGEIAGLVTLASLGVVALVLGGMTTAFRDGQVATAAYPDGMAESPATIGRGPLVSPSLWPILGAFGAVLLLLGLVFEFWMALAGIIVLVGVVFGWMVQSWADRASDDADYNRGLRERILNPVEFPILGALAAGLVVFGFSQLMLTLTKSAATAVFIGLAIVIVLVAALFSGARRLGAEVFVAALMIGAIVVLTAGIIGAVRGTRGFEAQEGEGANTETVANAANIAGRFELTDGGLTPSALSIPRALAVSFTFTNTTANPRRLVVEAEDILDSNGQPNGSKRTYATAFAEDGQTAFLTFQINLPGSYRFFSEAEDGEDRIEGSIRVA